VALAEQHEVALESVRAAGEGGEVGIDGGGERGRPAAPAAKGGLELRAVQQVLELGAGEDETKAVPAQLRSGGEQRLREGDHRKAAVETADEVLRM